MPFLELYSVRDQIVPLQSGLNWCFADAHVNTEDAYIALTTTFIRNYPNFFPWNNKVIDVVWDDGTTMVCSLEGTQTINLTTYPKQISSYDDKSIIGHYLRGRLGVSATHVVTMSDLKRYGRDNIEVTQIGGTKYYFDFS